MKTAFVYAPETVFPDDALAQFGDTRVPQCAKVIFVSPEAVGAATEQDMVREFREEIAAYTNEHDEPVVVAVLTQDISLLRRVVFDLLEHGLPVVFELDEYQRKLVGCE